MGENVDFNNNIKNVYKKTLKKTPLCQNVCLFMNFQFVIYLALFDIKHFSSNYTRVISTIGKKTSKFTWRNYYYFVFCVSKHCLFSTFQSPVKKFQVISIRWDWNPRPLCITKSLLLGDLFLSSVWLLRSFLTLFMQ